MGVPVGVPVGMGRVLVEEAGLQIHLFTHEDHHGTPDAVFPNNWFSTHSERECGQNTLVLYPMKVPNRRLERRPDLIERLHRCAAVEAPRQ